MKLNFAPAHYSQNMTTIHKELMFLCGYKLAYHRAAVADLWDNKLKFTGVTSPITGTVKPLA